MIKIVVDDRNMGGMQEKINVFELRGKFAKKTFQKYGEV